MISYPRSTPPLGTCVSCGLPAPSYTTDGVCRPCHTADTAHNHTRVGEWVFYALCSDLGAWLVPGSTVNPSDIDRKALTAAVVSAFDMVDDHGHAPWWVDDCVAGSIALYVSDILEPNP